MPCCGYRNQMPSVLGGRQTSFLPVTALVLRPVISLANAKATRPKLISEGTGAGGGGEAREGITPPSTADCGPLNEEGFSSPHAIHKGRVLPPLRSQGQKCSDRCALAAAVPDKEVVGGPCHPLSTPPASRVQLYSLSGRDAGMTAR